MGASSTPLLREARFIGFKSLWDVHVRFSSRFTLIVGRNAAGKSSVLDALGLVSEVVRKGSDESYSSIAIDALLPDVETLVTRGENQLRIGVGSTKAAWFEFRRIAADRPREYMLSVGGLPGLGLPIATADPTLTGTLDLRGNPADVRWKFLSKEELRSLLGIVRMQPLVSAAIEPAVMRGEPPALEPSGAGLAPVLFWLAANDRKAFDRLQEDLARVVPGVRSIRTPNVRGSGDTWQQSFELEMHDAGYLPANLLSEGTVLALALLTAVHMPGETRVLMLDDIEQGLHPEAQKQLVTCLRGILKGNPQLQIVATTHSPYLVDEMRGDEVIVLRADERGRTHARPLDQHPDWSRWASELGSGEFWSSVGDDWVLSTAVDPAAE